MGIMDRLRFWRQETQKRDWFGGRDLTAPSTFVSDLITQEIWERDQKDHQKEVAYKDDIANYVTVKIAENVFDDWFRFVKKIGDEEEIMMPAQKALKALNAKRWLTEALIAERIYGHAWLYTGPNSYRQDWIDAGLEGGQIANLDVFTPDNAIVPNNMYDENGVPVVLRVWYNASQGNMTHDLPYSDFIQFMTRPR